MSISQPLSVYKKLPKRLPYSLGFNKYALDFDPTLSQNVSVAIGAQMYWSTDIDFCYELVIKAPDTGAFNYLFYHSAAGGTGYVFIRIQADGTLFCRLYDGVTIKDITSISAVDDELWHHIVLNADRSGNGQLYIDRQADGAAVDISTLGTISPYALELGKLGTNYFKGQMAFFRSYKRLLSLHDIQYNSLNYHTPRMDDLVLWLPMEEGTGLTVNDRSGNSYNGSLLPGANPPTWIRTKKWELRAETGL